MSTLNETHRCRPAGHWSALAIFALVFSQLALAQSVPRARDLGVPFTGTPGPLNAITDVAGVEVGYTTLISDEPGDGKEIAVRTGVTAIFPRGKESEGFVFAGTAVLNGTGEMTGKLLIDEAGMFAGPVMLTGTTSVGVVRDAVTQWYRARLGADHPTLFFYTLPVVGETYDGNLNQWTDFQLSREHVFAALDSASGGAVAEGNVGGGTGMIAYTFKGGTGTASRRVGDGENGYTIGVLVQANFGVRRQLMIAGAPVGIEITDYQPLRPKMKDGSIIVVIATDAPLLPHQLERLARRASLGVARTGGMSGGTSGDIFLAFTTVQAQPETEVLQSFSFIDPWQINPLLEATVLATEEAIINALVAAQNMEGVNGNTVYALPHDRLQEVLRKYGRIED